MGILNVTPDSFSDGGRFHEPAAAVERAHQMISEGADLLDVGGESTRPGAVAVEEKEELRRVLPVLERLVGQVSIPISIDTQKANVAEQALKAGVSVVNDVGTSGDRSALWPLVAEYRAGYVAMHMQGTPQTMQSAPRYRDVITEVSEFFRERLTSLESAGVSSQQVVLDPGIGFGKSLDHNLELIAQVDRFLPFGRPVLLGVSRKSFLGRLLGTELGERLPGGLACTAWAALRGVQLFRTHDVAATVQLVRTLESLAARVPPVP
ncbi:MAG TPA: dihydropteroate synthase [Verrucomicrobiales bacterium]|nr:dihydropteroate synthase [Verrucomicrobiales bacterium]